MRKQQRTSSLILTCPRFAPSRPFTNALLHNQEITALIRDTEPHEHGLFSIDPSVRAGRAQPGSRNYANDSAARRKTLSYTVQPQSSAVARVLGSDLLRKIQSSNRETSRGRRVDIDILLQGVEKLCAACDVPGAATRVADLRARHEQISTSIQHYEGKVTKQQSSLHQLHGGSGEDEFPENTQEDFAAVASATMYTVTDDDLNAEEMAIKELELRKKGLEERVAGMQRDLGGLRR